MPVALLCDADQKTLRHVRDYCFIGQVALSRNDRVFLRQAVAPLLGEESPLWSLPEALETHHEAFLEAERAVFVSLGDQAALAARIQALERKCAEADLIASDRLWHVVTLKSQIRLLERRYLNRKVQVARLRAQLAGLTVTDRQQLEHIVNVGVRCSFCGGKNTNGMAVQSRKQPSAIICALCADLCHGQLQEAYETA